jgi:excisionase family DNA binding protein
MMSTANIRCSSQARRRRRRRRHRHRHRHRPAPTQDTLECLWNGGDPQEVLISNFATSVENAAYGNHRKLSLSPWASWRTELRLAHVNYPIGGCGSCTANLKFPARSSGTVSGEWKAMPTPLRDPGAQSCKRPLLPEWIGVMQAGCSGRLARPCPPFVEHWPIPPGVPIHDLYATVVGMAHRPSLPGFDTLPLLLQADEVAQLLRVSRKAVYTMAERGEIPGVTKLGRRLRFRRDALEAWLVTSAE